MDYHHFHCYLQLGSVGLAYQRFKMGSEAAFTQGLGEEGMEDQQYGQQYGGGPEDMGGRYGDQPFKDSGGGNQQGMGYSQQPMQY